MKQYNVIGYVSTRDIETITEADAKNLDVVNIAFGHMIDGEIVWKPENALEGIERVRNINPEIKFVLSVGGWSAGGFSEAAKDEESRKKVALSAADCVTKYGLDGIDIDWEYPCFSVAGIKASKEDKVNFTLYLKAIREELETLAPNKYLLTIAAGGGSYYVKNTQMEEVSKYLDYVQLMTYDLRGGFQTGTGHHTNLFETGSDLFEASVDTAVKAFVAGGVPKEKIVIGAAYYSRLWKGVPDVEHGLMQMAQTTGGYGPGYSTLASEYINKNGYVRYWDDTAKAPFLYNGDSFISYDDEESIRCKVDYVKEQGLLGIMYWEYCLDDSYTLTGKIREFIDA